MDDSVNKNTPAMRNRCGCGDTVDDDLLVVLKRVMPTVSTYKSLDTVTQANAEGNRILVQHDDDDDDDKESSKTVLAKELFVKRILASRYSHKAWPDLRRTLLYARTEVRFYSEILPQLKGFDSMTPHCYHAECNLDGLIPDDENVLDESKINPSSTEMQHAGGTIVLSSLNSNDYYQESPLNKTEASQCLRAAANLHAAAWEAVPLLSNAQKRLSKTSFHLGMRNPKELAGLVDSWNGFVKRFASLAPDLFAKRGIVSLGRRVHDMAPYICEQISPSPDDKYATLVHGDYKAMNIFLPRNGNKSNAVMIDFASVGVGLGMSDVAMHMVHALEPHNLQNGQEEELVNVYLHDLEKARMEKSGGKGVFSYPKSEAMRHYRLASIDYFRFILGRFWKGASPETFEKKKRSRNTTLVNRSFKAAFAFIVKIDKYLEEFEAEVKEGGQA